MKKEELAGEMARILGGIWKSGSRGERRAKQ
jgi:hypothetical protein